MLALETGWTPDVIARLPAGFRAACHWVLLIRTLVGDGIEEPESPPPGAPHGVRLAVTRARAAIGQLRAAIFPEDDDV